MKNILLADGPVGFQVCEWLIANYRDDIGLIVVTGDNEIKCVADAGGVPCAIYTAEQALLAVARSHGEAFDWGFLVWWPHIIGKSLIALPRHGFINTHPSLLPYNRGKHYNFWALVEQAPFGVSLHMVEAGIDCGDIIAQVPIGYDWEDTGATLYAKASAAISELFKATYPQIREGRIVRTPQDLMQGSFHLAKELEPASRIDLDAMYRARDLLNLLRARTFPGYPACRFRERDGQEYEVRVEIRRKDK